jgi:GNAT superfamily N-acetyltransferase
MATSPFHSYRVDLLPARTDDAAGVDRVYANSWPSSVEHVASLDVREELLKMRGVTFWQEEIRRRQDDRGQFLIARRGSQMVGFAGSANEPGGCWELIWLFVNPTAHGHGVGGQLHREMIAGSTCSRSGERFLWAVPGNGRAERFYADRGWRPTDSIKDVETPAGTFPLRKWIMPDVIADPGRTLTN